MFTRMNEYNRRTIARKLVTSRVKISLVGMQIKRAEHNCRHKYAAGSRLYFQDLQRCQGGKRKTLYLNQLYTHLAVHMISSGNLQTLINYSIAATVAPVEVSNRPTVCLSYSLFCVFTWLVYYYVSLPS